jgi:hypothetical protein
MKLQPTKEKVTIKWFVWSGGQKMPKTSNMAGNWGYDFECSCGHKSNSGGAIYSSIKEEVWDHKFYDHDYSIK